MHLAHPRFVRPGQRGSTCGNTRPTRRLPGRRKGPGATGRPRTRAAADPGVSSAEYSLALAGVAGLVVLAVLGLGDQLSGMFDCLSEQLRGAPAACTSGSGDDPGGPLGPAPDPTDQPDAPPTTGPGPGPAPVTTAPTTTTTTGTTTTATTTTGTTPPTSGATATTTPPAPDTTAPATSEPGGVPGSTTTTAPGG